MNCNKPNIKKLVQVSEEAQTPIHVPIVLGNECFIITQQDVRRIEDVRMLTYSKLGPNGQLIPMESLGHDANIIEALLNAYKIQQQQLQQQQYFPNQNNIFDQSPVRCYNNSNVLAELMRNLCGAAAGGTQAMSTSKLFNAAGVQTAATLEQQMAWDKMQCNSSAPFPLNYSTGTSTSDIKPHVHFQQHCNCAGSCCQCCCCRSTSQTANSRGCSTMDVDDDDCGTFQMGNIRSAREQLKDKKMAQTSCGF